MNKYGMISLLVMLVLVLGACGGNTAGEAPEAESPAATVPPTPAGDADNGEALFEQTCVACHGPGGVGIEGLGKDMTVSEFIRGQSDDELVAFLKTGRPSSDPLNTTGVDMPPKGGNPALSDADLLDIVAYMRTLQK